MCARVGAIVRNVHESLVSLKQNPDRKMLQFKLDVSKIISGYEIDVFWIS